jgi:transcriptional regulator with XRE-family HTH domain
MQFIPERLIELRKELGITRAEAARRLNMSAMGYGRYERGERTPSYQTVSYIANAFSTTTGYLYGISDEKTPGTITINSSDDPELFSFVKTIQQADAEMLQRLITYKNLIEGKKTHDK